jgi:low temperature requirement protein LtrA
LTEHGSLPVTTRPTTPIVSPDDQRVTFVELFFDIVFVFCVTQVAHLFAEHIDLLAVASSLVVFWLVWWAWTQFTWALNAANTDHSRVQAITLLATALAFFMGVGIPGAVQDGAIWFAIPYITVRVIGLLLYFWVAWGDPLQRRAVRIFAALSVTGLIAVLLGAIQGGQALYWWWSAAIALDLLAAHIGGQLEGWNLHPEHFVERHGLIVIIALGETLIVAAAGLIGAPRTPTVIVTSVLAVAVTCGLWWSYFARARHTLERILTEQKGSLRSQAARDIFSVIHFPMLCGVLAIAAVVEQALAHPDQSLTLSSRIALGMGITLFVCGTAVALWRGTGKTSGPRWVLAPMAAIAIILLGATPWIALLIGFGMLSLLGVVEHRSMISFAGEH